MCLRKNREKKQDKSSVDVFIFIFFFHEGQKKWGKKVTIPKSSDDVCFNEDKRSEKVEITCVCVSTIDA